EIEAVGPKPDETEGLEIEVARLGFAERLLELAAAVEDAIGRDGGVAEGLASAANDLRAVAELDAGAADLAARCAGLAAEAAELTHDVRDYRDGVTVDPGRLEDVRDRIGALK